jgi:ribosomal protein S18 acetylase RimI-like enzyme
VSITIQRSSISDQDALVALYRKIATVPGGIIRQASEIDDAYINDFLTKSINNGLALVACTDQKIVGEIHAYTPNVAAFQHLLTDLTIVIDHEHHGQGIGRQLFEAFLSIVAADFQHILRVELFVRESNERNVNFYKSLGFKNEGRQEFKILNAQSALETPLHMAWFNPNFKKQ